MESFDFKAISRVEYEEDETDGSIEEGNIGSKAQHTELDDAEQDAHTGHPELTHDEELVPLNDGADTNAALVSALNMVLHQSSKELHEAASNDEEVSLKEDVAHAKKKENTDLDQCFSPYSNRSTTSYYSSFTLMEDDIYDTNSEFGSTGMGSFGDMASIASTMKSGDYLGGQKLSNIGHLKEELKNSPKIPGGILSIDSTINSSERTSSKKQKIPPKSRTKIKTMKPDFSPQTPPRDIVRLASTTVSELAIQSKPSKSQPLSPPQADDIKSLDGEATMDTAELEYYMNELKGEESLKMSGLITELKSLRSDHFKMKSSDQRSSKRSLPEAGTSRRKSTRKQRSSSSLMEEGTGKKRLRHKSANQNSSRSLGDVDKITSSSSMPISSRQNTSRSSVRKERDNKSSRPRTRKQRSSRSLVDDERAKSLTSRPRPSKQGSSRSLVEGGFHSSSVKEERDKKPSRPKTRKQRSSRSLVDDGRAKSSTSRPRPSKQGSSRSLVEEEIYLSSVKEERDKKPSRPRTRKQRSSRSLVDDGHAKSLTSRPRPSKQVSSRSLVEAKIHLSSVKEERDNKPSRPRTRQQSSSRSPMRKQSSSRSPMRNQSSSRSPTRKQSSSRSLVDGDRSATSLTSSRLTKQNSSRALVEEEIHCVLKVALDEIYSVLEEAKEATSSRPKPQRHRSLADDHHIRKSSRPKTRKQLSTRSLAADERDLRSPPRQKTRGQSSSRSLLAGDKKENGHSRSSTRPKSRKQYSSRSLSEAEKKVEVSRPMPRKQRSSSSVGMDDTTGVSSRPSSRSTKQRSSRSLVDLEKKVTKPKTRKQRSPRSRIDSEEETNVSPRKPSSSRSRIDNEEETHVSPRKPSSWKQLLEMDEEQGGFCSSRPRSTKKISLGTVEDQQSRTITTKERSPRSLGAADRHRELRKNLTQKASRQSVRRGEKATQSSRSTLTTVLSSEPLSDEDLTSNASIPSSDPASSDRTSHADEESEATFDGISRSQ
jgi:hypothetical protein